MNKVFCLVFFSLFTFCKSKNTVTQKKEEVKREETKKVEKPKVTFSNQEKPLSPGTIKLIASIKEITPQKAICEKQYPLVLSLEIETILSSGSSVVNMLSNEQKTEIGVRKHLVDSLKKSLGDKKTLTVKEKLCFDTNKTVYEIIEIED